MILILFVVIVIVTIFKIFTLVGLTVEGFVLLHHVLAHLILNYKRLINRSRIIDTLK